MFDRVVFCIRVCFFFFQAEDGIRYLVRSRGLGDVYKRQGRAGIVKRAASSGDSDRRLQIHASITLRLGQRPACLLYTSDAADERSSVDLGGRRIIKKKTNIGLSRAENNVYTLEAQHTCTTVRLHT